MPKPIVIDLSHYQVIPHDLNDTRAAGIEAVIHKMTEGTSKTDAKAHARYSLAKDAGMLFGLYHFLRPGKIREQADFFLDKASFAPDALLVCDFEVDAISLYEVLAFLRRVEQVSGQKPVLYSGNTLKAAGGAAKCPELADYRLWIAQYRNTAPTLPRGYKSWWLWQYTEKGEIAGVDGTCDLNAYNGDASDLRRDWVIQSSAVSSSVDSRHNSDTQADNNPPDTDPTGTDTLPPITPSEPVVVQKEKPSVWAKIIAIFTTVSAIGINLGTLIQQKLQELTPIQIGYLIAVLALAAIGIWIYQKAARGAQMRTMQLVEKAADPKQYTVELKK
jgi:lysozyme